jgi:hypothetical protein
MRTTVVAVTALAGSLLLAPLMLGPTQAGSAPDLNSALSASHDGVITLVRGGGGGGVGGGGGHPGAMARGDGGGRGFAGPRMGGPRFAEGRDRGHFEHGDRGRFVERHDRGEQFEHRRFAERHHDFDRFHHRHRVFVNGVWVWVYAYGDDCWWLRRQALITGSPYWWSRYNLCVGYY